MSTELKVFLGVALGWAALAGLALHLTSVDLGSVLGVALIAVLYMPSPFIAAVVAERGLVRHRSIAEQRLGLAGNTVCDRYAVTSDAQPT